MLCFTHMTHNDFVEYSDASISYYFCEICFYIKTTFYQISHYYSHRNSNLILIVLLFLKLNRIHFLHAINIIKIIEPAETTKQQFQQFRKKKKLVFH